MRILLFVHIVENVHLFIYVHCCCENEMCSVQLRVCSCECVGRYSLQGVSSFTRMKPSPQSPGETISRVSQEEDITYINTCKCQDRHIIHINKCRQNITN